LETSYVGSSPTIGIFLCAYLKSWWLQMMVDMKTKMCIFTNNKIEGNEELYEGNVFCNCIMVIHNFIAMDRTGYQLLVMADKGG